MQNQEKEKDLYEKDLREIKRCLSMLYGARGLLQTEVDIDVDENAVRAIVDEFKYVIHCRAGTKNYQGVTLSFRAPHPRREGDHVAMYGEDWVVEHCDVIQHG